MSAKKQKPKRVISRNNRGTGVLLPASPLLNAALEAKKP